MDVGALGSRPPGMLSQESEGVAHRLGLEAPVAELRTTVGSDFAPEPKFAPKREWFCSAEPHVIQGECYVEPIVPNPSLAQRECLEQSGMKQKLLEWNPTWF